MILKSTIAALAFSLAGFFGCAKPAAPSVAKAPVAAAQTKITDLGIVHLTNHCETCVVLNAQKNCRIVPKIMDHQNVRLTLTLESASADGKTSDLSVVQVMANSGKPLDISIGNTNFTFTPEIAAK